MNQGFYCCGSALVLIDFRNRVTYYDDSIGGWLNIKLPLAWALMMVPVEVYP